MPVIYVDNFRGFKNTFIPLKKINFFVGENSTGKTSLLKLIHIISQPGFWHYQQFNTNDVSLGSFYDILSFDHGIKQFFEVAVLGDESEGYISAIRLRFIESEKFPQLKELSFVDNYINLQATFEGKTVLKYRFLSNERSGFLDNPITFFEGWIKSHGLDEQPFFKEEVEFIGIRSILFQLQALISTRLGELSQITPRNEPMRFKIPAFLQNIAWFAPIRTEPRKTYDEYITSFDSKGRHSPYILEERLISDRGEAIKRILQRFGKDSGLFDDIQTQKLSMQTDKPASFEIQLVMGSDRVNLTNVGYGVSQVLPLLVEVVTRPEPTWFAVQQPEIHLHPRAQAALGDFIFKAMSIDSHSFILETHSDYLVDRFRLRISRAFREGSYETEAISQVVFFQKNENKNHLQTIEILKDGAYPDDQPSEFKEFFIKEQLNLITI